MSGVEVGEGCISLFNAMKTTHSNKWATFKIEGKKTVVVDQKGGQNQDPNADRDKFNEMVRSLGTEPRYILFDFIFEMGGRKIQKIAFIFWYV